MTTTKRLLATLLAGAGFAGTALLTAAPAHAGFYCLVIPRWAPVYEHPDAHSREVTQIDAGTVVAATSSANWDMHRVRFEHADEFLGYMKRYNLDCSITG